MLLTIVRNPWAVGALSVLLVGGIQQGRVWYWQNQTASCKQEAAEARAAGQEAARRAVEAAVAAERERQAQRKADEDAALERLSKAAKEAQDALEGWKRRYREAVEQDATCRAWAAETIRCPLP
jgi:hypothetical protein